MYPSREGGGKEREREEMKKRGKEKRLAVQIMPRGFDIVCVIFGNEGEEGRKGR